MDDAAMIGDYTVWFGDDDDQVECEIISLLYNAIRFKPPSNPKGNSPYSVSVRHIIRYSNLKIQHLNSVFGSTGSHNAKINKFHSLGDMHIVIVIVKHAV